MHEICLAEAMLLLCQQVAFGWICDFFCSTVSGSYYKLHQSRHWERHILSPGNLHQFKIGSIILCVEGSQGSVDGVDHVGIVERSQEWAPWAQLTNVLCRVWGGMTLGVHHPELAVLFQDVEVTVSLHRVLSQLPHRTVCQRGGVQSMASGLGGPSEWCMRWKLTHWRPLAMLWTPPRWQTVL